MTNLPGTAGSSNVLASQRGLFATTKNTDARDVQLKSVRSTLDGGMRAPPSTDGGPVVERIEWSIENLKPLAPKYRLTMAVGQRALQKRVGYDRKPRHLEM